LEDLEDTPLIPDIICTMDCVKSSMKLSLGKHPRVGQCIWRILKRANNAGSKNPDHRILLGQCTLGVVGCTHCAGKYNRLSLRLHDIAYACCLQASGDSSITILCLVIACTNANIASEHNVAQLYRLIAPSLQTISGLVDAGSYLNNSPTSRPDGAQSKCNV
jgi:hypothetical protein